MFLALPIIAYHSYNRPVVYPPRNDQYYFDKADWTTSTATLGNSFNTVWSFPDSEITAWDDHNCEFNKLGFNPVERVFRVSCQSSEKALAPIAYFPGWQVKLNGSLVPFWSESG